ncbi:DJ-1/PfpI family protein [candidate division NPL-UPA2 bacterium Unc8]|uniref:DJ-1/PfpI family protein n=1 Tax=candidate division NPL-UPA2 bacterium Unc8 TaxID=1980939 RepID=A0A399FU03_UNCN2|nr:MAG: DJ-1/PfpI family protein [candidate division NPL-UPA2 bacterium Unc8]
MKIAVPFTEGFEEIEFSAIVDILRRTGIDVTTFGLIEGAVKGSHGIKVMADSSIDELKAGDFDGIVLPGGYPNFVKLGEDERVLKLVREMDAAGKWIAAICGAPSVLSKAGVLQGKKATIHPAVKDMLTDAHYVNERVIVDGNLITSQGPGTAVEFSIKLVEILTGKEKAKEVSTEILAGL